MTVTYHRETHHAANVLSVCFWLWDTQ